MLSHRLFEKKRTWPGGRLEKQQKNNQTWIDSLYKHCLLIFVLSFGQKSHSSSFSTSVEQNYCVSHQSDFSVHLSTCIYLTVTRTHTSNVPTHAQTPADVSHRELTDTCPLPNCRFTKSAGCGCQAVSDWMPSSCRDSRSWPSCNCRDDAISPAHLLCTSVPKQKTTDSQSAQRK